MDESTHTASYMHDVASSPAYEQDTVVSSTEDAEGISNCVGIGTSERAIALTSVDGQSADGGEQ